MSKSEWDISRGELAELVEKVEVDTSTITAVIAKLEEMRDIEQVKLDNLPEGLQESGPTAEKLQERIDSLETAIDEMEEVKDEAEELKQRAADAVQEVVQ
jgi:prefoldin subunit 5